MKKNNQKILIIAGLITFLIVALALVIYFGFIKQNFLGFSSTDKLTQITGTPGCRPSASPDCVEFITNKLQFGTVASTVELNTGFSNFKFVSTFGTGSTFGLTTVDGEQLNHCLQSMDVYVDGVKISTLKSFTSDGTKFTGDTSKEFKLYDSSNKSYVILKMVDSDESNDIYVLGCTNWINQYEVGWTNKVLNASEVSNAIVEGCKVKLPGSNFIGLNYRFKSTTFTYPCSTCGSANPTQTKTEVIPYKVESTDYIEITTESSTAKEGCVVEENKTYYRFSNNNCTQISILQSEKTDNDYNTLDNCNSKINGSDNNNSANTSKIDIYRVVNESCIKVNILPATKNSTIDFSTESDCKASLGESNTKWFIILGAGVVLIIIIVIVFLKFSKKKGRK